MVQVTIYETEMIHYRCENCEWMLSARWPQNLMSGDQVNGTCNNCGHMTRNLVRSDRVALW